MSKIQAGSYGRKDVLDNILADARAAGQLDQIFKAHDEDGDLAIHKAAINGNPTCIEWIIQTWKENGIELNIDEKDHNGRSPLFLVCYKGYVGA